MTLAELAKTIYTPEYGAYTDAADPKGSLYSRLKKDRDSGNPGVDLEGHKYHLTPAKRREMELGE